MPYLKIDLLLTQDNSTILFFGLRSFLLYDMLCSSVAFIINGSHGSGQFGLSEKAEVGQSGSGLVV
jgi:hypothetical protein